VTEERRAGCPSHVGLRTPLALLVPGAFIYLDGELLKNRESITLRYALPARTTEEKCDKTIWRLAWRGDVVIDSVPERYPHRA